MEDVGHRRPRARLGGRDGDGRSRRGRRRELGCGDRHGALERAARAGDPDRAVRTRRALVLGTARVLAEGGGDLEHAAREERGRDEERAEEGGHPALGLPVPASGVNGRPAHGR